MTEQHVFRCPACGEGPENISRKFLPTKPYGGELDCVCWRCGYTWKQEPLYESEIEEETE